MAIDFSAGDGGLTILSSLAVFCLSLLPALRCFGCIILRRPRLAPWVDWPLVAIACAVTSYLAADSMGRFPAVELAWLPRATWLGWTFVAVLVCFAYFVYVYRSYQPNAHVPTWASWMVASITVCLASWSGHLYYSQVTPVVAQQIGNIAPGQLQRLQRSVAVTDQGSRVSLYHWDGNAAEFAEYAETSDSRQTDFLGRTVLRAATNAESNCHGWVFTGGRFHLTGSGVATILKDNGYEIVTEPQANDVIIYRNSREEIVHTGLVRGVLNDKSVIIESKWAVEGRFLHAPLDQPYGERFAYYRSPRKDHLVQIAPSFRNQFVQYNRSRSSRHRFHWSRASGHSWCVSWIRPRTDAL